MQSQQLQQNQYQFGVKQEVENHEHTMQINNQTELQIRKQNHLEMQKQAQYHQQVRPNKIIFHKTVIN